MKRWLDSAWTQEMRLEIDVNLMMSSGSWGRRKELPKKTLKSWFPRSRPIQEQLEEEKNQGQSSFSDPALLICPFAARIKKYVQETKTWAENFVVLGIGGSALGAKALQTALTHPHTICYPRPCEKDFPDSL